MNGLIHPSRFFLTLSSCKQLALYNFFRRTFLTVHLEKAFVGHAPPKTRSSSLPSLGTCLYTFAAFHHVFSYPNTAVSLNATAICTGKIFPDKRFFCGSFRDLRKHIEVIFLTNTIAFEFYIAVIHVVCYDYTRVVLKLLTPPSQTKTDDLFINWRFNYSKVFTVGVQSFFGSFQPRPEESQLLKGTSTSP